MPVGSAEARKIAAIRDLERAGAMVRTAAADVADAQAMKSVLDGAASAGWPPVRGAIHAAGTVQGALLQDLDRQALLAVLRPKVTGGWVLHHLLRDSPLDFFVLFSAIPSILGWLGQGAANYASANAFLDALAFHRRALGLAAQTVVWGPWKEIGMAARVPGGLQGLARLGVAGLSTRQALRAFDRLFSENAAHAAVVSVDWPQFFRANPGAVTAPLLSQLRVDPSAAPKGEAWGLSRAALSAAEPREARRLLTDALREQLANVLRVDPSGVDTRIPITQMGLDSLMAIEVKAQIQSALEVSVPLVSFLKGPSLAELVSQIVDLIAAAPARAQGDGNGAQPVLRTEAGAAAVEGDEASRVAQLSDAEVDSMLRRLYSGEGN
jgi:acyl carrier protein